MLRIKRSVEALSNTDAGYVAAAQAGAARLTENGGGIDESGDPMADLERQAPLEGFVEASTGPVGGGASV
jgi:hypothetical protein